jgi:predicted restriction endonuclease
VNKIRQAYLSTYPDDSEVSEALDQVFGPDETTTNEGLAEAERQLREEHAFDPTGIEDARERVLSSIVRRRGQPGFRSRLLSAYQGRCAITGDAVEAVLEAAHIISYKGTQTNHVGNGLLLRSDWHTRFDLRLVTVDPETMRLLVSPKLAGTAYHKYNGKAIKLPNDPANWPSKEALRQHQRESSLRS